MSGRKERKLAAHTMPLWKAIGLSFLMYLPFSAFLLIIPPYSSGGAWVVAGMLIASGMLAVNVGRFTSPRLSEIGASFIFNLQFLAIGIRAFAAVMPVRLIWLGPLLIAYGLVWVLPFVLPAVSDALFKEQMAPTTWLGQRILLITLGITPAAGVLGAGLGMFSSRTGDLVFVWIVVGLLMSFVALGWGQTIAHQLFAELNGSRVS